MISAVRIRFFMHLPAMHAGIPTIIVMSTAVVMAALAAISSFPFSSGHAQAQAPPTVETQDSSTLEDHLSYDEKTAQSIDGMLMCPVCPAETIDQAQVPIARQMRQLVREKLAMGESREQILEYFARVYGKDILAAPPKTRANLVVWTVPVVGVIAALTAGLFVLRSMRMRPDMEPAMHPETPTDLSHYLDTVDRKLGITERDMAPVSSTKQPIADEAGENRSPNG